MGFIVVTGGLRGQEYSRMLRWLGTERTLVPDQPNLNAASCASNSPNPNIKPLMNGSRRFIAAPLRSPHTVGGE
jgi:hypothetical protein